MAVIAAIAVIAVVGAATAPAVQAEAAALAVPVEAAAVSGVPVVPAEAVGQVAAAAHPLAGAAEEGDSIIFNNK